MFLSINLSLPLASESPSDNLFIVLGRNLASKSNSIIIMKTVVLVQLYNSAYGHYYNNNNKNNE